MRRPTHRVLCDAGGVVALFLGLGLAAGTAVAGEQRLSGDECVIREAVPPSIDPVVVIAPCTIEERSDALDDRNEQEIRGIPGSSLAKPISVSIPANPRAHVTGTWSCSGERGV